MSMLSVIIPNYNYGHFADRFFSSVAAQSLDLNDVDIIFVDDGSDDDSLEQAGKWANKILCRNFEILTPPHCGKPGLVRNHGLATAQGEFLICLDPDDTLHPEFLATCIEAFRMNPDAGLVYTDYLENSGTGSREVMLPDFNPAHLRTQNILPPTAMFRRTLWDAGVRFRANTEYEDWDFWVQCQMRGTTFFHIRQTLYMYEIHDTNYSQHAVRNDGHAKAMIVVNNPSFFHPTVQEWAHGHLRNRAHSPAFQRGYIPRPVDINALLTHIGHATK